MVRINISHDIIIISGHAKYNDYGNDIVCASISSIVYTTINAILNIDNSAIKLIDNKVLNIKILKHSEVVDILINNMLTMLDELVRQYPKNIKIVKGE